MPVLPVSYCDSHKRNPSVALTTRGDRGAFRCVPGPRMLFVAQGPGSAPCDALGLVPLNRSRLSPSEPSFLDAHDRDTRGVTGWVWWSALLFLLFLRSSRVSRGALPPSTACVGWHTVCLSCYWLCS